MFIAREFSPIQNGQRNLCLLTLVVLFSGGAASQAQPPANSDHASRPQPQPRVRLPLPPDTSRPSFAPEPKADNSPTEFEIPDGTPVHLRLAQPVRGPSRTLVRIKVYTREGDTIRLVASEDVRVNGMVVIPKGAKGQATVTQIQVPGLSSSGTFQKGQAIELLIPKTGSVTLELDWVEDITGHKVFLRAEPTGVAKPFVMAVSAEQGGMIVRPNKFKKDMANLFTGHLRSWAPTGSRLMAFADGATRVDPDEVKAAQELLPVPNPNGILTIYRTKSQTAEKAQVSCDDKEIVSLGQLQYFAFEVQPGKHTCQVGQQQPVEFSAAAGELVYLHILRKSSHSRWELIPVTVEEGEDGTANGVIVEDARSSDLATDVAH